MVVAKFCAVFVAKYFSTFFKKLERKLGGCRELWRMQRKTFQIPQFAQQTKSSVLQSSIYIINIYHQYISSISSSCYDLSVDLHIEAAVGRLGGCTDSSGNFRKGQDFDDLV